MSLREQFSSIGTAEVVEALLGGEQAWTSSFYLKSFDMDSVQVGKAVFVKENYTTMGIEPKTFSNTGSFGNRTSVCWVKNFNGLLKQFNL